MSAPAWSGCLSWFDLMAPDEAAAAAFYGKVVGWGTSVWTQGPAPYTMFTRGGDVAIGGIRDLPPGTPAPPHWLSYIATHDLEAVLATVERLGGKRMMGPVEVAAVGSWAVFLDPQGAAFAAIQPATPPADPFPQGPGAVAWLELATSDHVAAWAFYEAVFGWELAMSTDMGPMGEYRLFKVPGASAHLGGMFTTPSKWSEAPNWLPYADVADLEAAVEAVEACGGAVVNGPMVVPGGDRIAQIRDDQGAMFALHVPAPGGS